MRQEEIQRRAETYLRSHPDANPVQVYMDAFMHGYRSKLKPKEIDLSFVAPDMLAVVTKWLDYKKERKNPYNTQRGVESLYKKLCAMSGENPRLADAIVEQSIANNWQGLFELKNGYTTTKIYPSGRAFDPTTVAGRRQGIKDMADLAERVLLNPARPEECK